MSESLDISVHGMQRAVIIERLMHICRHDSGMVFLSGEAAKSPVIFLRHMANLLRDELHVAMLSFSSHADGCVGVDQVAAALIQQWSVYCAAGDGQTDIQRIHHYLDVVSYGGRMALIIVERAAVMNEEATNFLVGLLARHSRLTVLFAGVQDTQVLLARAQQSEVSVHQIVMPENTIVGSFVPNDQEDIPAAELHAPQKQLLQNNQVPINENYLFDDDFCGTAPNNASSNGRLFDEYAADQAFIDSGMAATREESMERWGEQGRGYGERKEPVLDAGAEYSVDYRAKADDRAGLRRKSSALPQLLIAFAVLSALLVAGWLYYPRETSGDRSLSVQGIGNLPMSVSGHSQNGTVDQQPLSRNQPTISKVGSDDRKLQSTVAPEAEIGSKPLIKEMKKISENKLAKRGGNVADTQSAAKPLSAAKPKAEKKLKADKKLKAEKKALMPSTLKDWKSVPRDRYTIQLAAAHADGGMATLVGKLPKSQPHLLYRQTLSSGKPWLVLIYGVYPDKEAAIAARNQLSATINGPTPPWVRKISNVIP